MKDIENTLSVDIAIIGGGIAGLWALNRLRTLGYSVILLEASSLGGGQTIKSQGIIHGGIKYALQGFLTPSANSIQGMPARWQACLEGSGEIDLRNIKLLSKEQLLWSTGSLTSEIAGFFASKTLNSRVETLTKTQYPLVLQNPKFKGHVYRLNEIVLDTPSLIRALVSPHQECIFKVNAEQGIQIVCDDNNPTLISHLTIQSGTRVMNIRPKRTILAAGEGNALLTQSIKSTHPMQRRPLQMVLVKSNKLTPLFAHCIDNGMTPRITITAHIAKDGIPVWYLGGQIAEAGIHKTQSEQIAAAKKELAALFPWLTLEDAKWASFFVDRAEPAQPGGKRPENEFLQSIGNVLLAWPTKLALTPLLTDQIEATLKQQNIMPSQTNLSVLSGWEKPSIAEPMWETLPFSNHI